MKNPIYEAYSGNQPMNAFMQRFQEFARTMKGDPKAQVQQLLNSGKITQQQYDNAVQMANQMMKMMK